MRLSECEPGTDPPISSARALGARRDRPGRRSSPPGTRSSSSALGDAPEADARRESRRSVRQPRDRGARRPSVVIAAVLIGLALAAAGLAALSLRLPSALTTLLAGYLALVGNLALVTWALSPFHAVTRSGLRSPDMLSSSPQRAVVGSRPAGPAARRSPSCVSAHRRRPGHRGVSRRRVRGARLRARAGGDGAAEQLRLPYLPPLPRSRVEAGCGDSLDPERVHCAHERVSAARGAGDPVPVRRSGGRCALCAAAVRRAARDPGRGLRRVEAARLRPARRGLQRSAARHVQPVRPPGDHGAERHRGGVVSGRSLPACSSAEARPRRSSPASPSESVSAVKLTTVLTWPVLAWLGLDRRTAHRQACCSRAASPRSSSSASGATC